MSVYRGRRCGECYWALYDGWMCQNKSCKRFGQRITEPESIRLSNDEAAALISWKELKDPYDITGNPSTWE